MLTRQDLKLAALKFAKTLARLEYRSYHLQRERFSGMAKDSAGQGPASKRPRTASAGYDSFSQIAKQHERKLYKLSVESADQADEPALCTMQASC